MKLFLSSENLGNYPGIFINMFGQDKRLALIENAKDYLTNQERRLAVREHLIQFQSLGFDCDEIDLRKYFSNSDDLKSLVHQFNGVWVTGEEMKKYYESRALDFYALKNGQVILVNNDKVELLK